MINDTIQLNYGELYNKFQALLNQCSYIEFQQNSISGNFSRSEVIDKYVEVYGLINEMLSQYRYFLERDITDMKEKCMTFEHMDVEMALDIGKTLLEKGAES